MFSDWGFRTHALDQMTKVFFSSGCGYIPTFETSRGFALKPCVFGPTFSDWRLCFLTGASFFLNGACFVLGVGLSDSQRVSAVN